MFHTGDGGASWEWRQASRATFGSVFPLVFDTVFQDPLVPDVVLAHESFGVNTFQRSTDGGVTWARAELDVRGAGASFGGSVLVRPTIAAHPQREGEYLLGDLVVQRTRDFGATWQAIGPIPRELSTTAGFNAVGGLAIDPRDAERIAASLGDSLWRSDDDGLTWQSTGPIRRGEGIFSLAYHPTAAGRLYAATVGGLYLSRDDGVTWEARVAPVSSRWTSARIRQHPLDADRAYLVASRELYATRDGGVTWAAMHGEFAGLPWFNDVAVSPSRPDEVYAATTWGLYTVLAGPTTVVAEAPGVGPGAPALAQNYPNPFNAGTVIAFRLPRPSAALLEVFDLLGQRVRTLAREHLAAGDHFRRWDGRDDGGRQVASGVYLYRLEAGDRALTRRLLLLR